VETPFNGNVIICETTNPIEYVKTISLVYDKPMSFYKQIKLNRYFSSRFKIAKTDYEYKFKSLKELDDEIDRVAS
jgi:hypothetical protein